MHVYRSTTPTITLGYVDTSAMAPQLILTDIQEAFLQTGLKEEDRDAFRFLFNINGIEEHFRFTRIPFGGESSPFMLGATVQHHLDLQPTDVQDTVQALKDNTYVDNIMQIGSDIYPSFR